MLQNNRYKATLYVTVLIKSKNTSSLLEEAGDHHSEMFYFFVSYHILQQVQPSCQTE